MKNLHIVPCSTLADLKKRLRNSRCLNVAISTGVNDIDSKSGGEVFYMIKEITEIIWKKNTHMRIIFNEITPRNDERDEKVVICNKLVKDFSRTQDQLFLATQDNLRNGEWSLHVDAKHISTHGIAKFASNMKRAFREAVGFSVYPRNIVNSGNSKYVYGKNKKKSFHGNTGNYTNDAFNAYKKEILSKLNQLFQSD